MYSQASYDEIRPELKTGDVLLFSGKGFVSWSIKFGSYFGRIFRRKRSGRPRWSHVGMIVRNESGVFLYESTTLSTVKDTLTGRKVQGVQLVLLSERLRGYKGKVALLAGPRLPEGSEAVLRHMRQEFKGTPYEESKLELLRSLVDIGRENKADTSSMFCSELVATAYQRMGFSGSFPDPANEYIPSDFEEMELFGWPVLINP